MRAGILTSGLLGWQLSWGGALSRRSGSTLQACGL